MQSATYIESAIYAVVNFGNVHLVVGPANRLSAHWPRLLKALSQGRYPDGQVQTIWDQFQDRRQFSFHTGYEVIQAHDWTHPAI